MCHWVSSSSCWLSELIARSWWWIGENEKVIRVWLSRVSSCWWEFFQFSSNLFLRVISCWKIVQLWTLSIVEKTELFQIIETQQPKSSFKLSRVSSSRKITPNSSSSSTHPPIPSLFTIWNPPGSSIKFDEISILFSTFFFSLQISFYRIRWNLVVVFVLPSHLLRFDFNT